MKAIHGCCVFLIVMTALTVTPYHVADAAGLLLYDTFNTTYINPDKWVGQDTESDSSHPVLRESVRQIQGNRLHLLARASACATCGNEDHLWGANRLRPLKLQNATILQAALQVKDLSLVDSGTNTDAALARARILGYFFNDGNSSGTNDATGDVYAWIGVHRSSDSSDPEGELSVDAYVKKCNDASCKFNQTVLGKIEKLGTLKVGNSATLKMQWDKTNHQFIFTLNGINPQTIGYGVIQVVKPPITTSNRRLEVHLEVPNSTVTPHPSAFMDAYFDSVYYK
jgi:hypothetical protein